MNTVFGVFQINSCQYQISKEKKNSINLETVSYTKIDILLTNAIIAQNIFEKFILQCFTVKLNKCSV